MPHCHHLRRHLVTEMRVTRPDISPMQYGASSPLHLAWSLLPHKCTVLSGYPDPDALRLSALLQGYALINISSQELAGKLRPLTIHIAA